MTAPLALLFASAVSVVVVWGGFLFIDIADGERVAPAPPAASWLARLRHAAQMPRIPLLKARRVPATFWPTNVQPEVASFWPARSLPAGLLLTATHCLPIHEHSPCLRPCSRTPGQSKPEPPQSLALHIASAHVHSAALAVAVRLRVAEALHKLGPAPIGRLAAAVGARPGPLARVLRALAAVGIFQETQEGGVARLSFPMAAATARPLCQSPPPPQPPPPLLLLPLLTTPIFSGPPPPAQACLRTTAPPAH